MSIKALAHVCIKTTDLKKTSDFYCDALGMEKLFAFTRKGTVIGFYLKASNDTFIEVFRTDQREATSTSHVLSHFCLQTESIKDLRERLLEKSYSPREIKLGADNSYQFWVTDPNGLDLEVHQYTDQSSQITGADVEVNW